VSMNQTPEASRTHIAIFGRANVGKSSLINAMTGQTVSIVSEQSGTTTDPVKKAMELLPLGPVVLIDTAGLDDDTALGQLRVSRAMRELRRADIVLFVANSQMPPTGEERRFLSEVQGLGKPIVIALNKADLGTPNREWGSQAAEWGATWLPVSALTGEGVDRLRQALAQLRPAQTARPLVRDLVRPGDTAILVVPIDDAAPKGRLILPQQQVIRDLLDGGAMPLVCRDREYEAALNALGKPPALVVTDSQIFPYVAQHTPDSVPLTSFSMLFARFKGDLDQLTQGVAALDALGDGDRVLIAEGCTHHRQCDDIGTVKLPKWIAGHTGARLDFHFTSGQGFPDHLSEYKLVVHCGGCMLNDTEMRARLRQAADAGVPITNYGILIAHMNGILTRCLAPFR
jgi:[FeFe] hydrogenase H-cluster maturation GTPase HydF